MEVRRDRTAIARSDLSRPVQLLIGNGVLTPKHTFFDYGSGLGDDVRFLQSLGYVAHGWDPAHRPDEARRNAEVVNLGYVLNVIERPGERAEALRRAFELSEKCLCVAVLVGSAVLRRGSPDLWRRAAHVAQHLSEVLPAGRGGTVPRRGARRCDDPARSRRVPGLPAQCRCARLPAQSPSALGAAHPRSFPRERKRVLRTALMSTFQTQHAEEWAAYADFVSARGRPPGAGELDALRVAAENGLAPADLWEAASGVLPEQQLAEQRRRRTNQYLVFMAISRFRGVPKMRDLPVTSRFDIRYYFRSYSNLKQLSDEHLFAAGDEDRVARLCEAAPVGVNTSDGYFVARRDLPSLDPILQIYARLGELFSGDLDRIDVIKIHKTSPRLSLFAMSDVQETIPRLKSRVKIDLQTQQVRFFDHSTNVGAGTARGKAAPRLR